MTDDTKPERFSLSRWSRRKLEASRGQDERALSEKAPAAPVLAPAPTDQAREHGIEPGEQGPSVELPPVESLTIDSDFTPFLKPEVEDTLRHAALRKLFRDPRFNVMDGLDVYIDDYTQASPIPGDVLAKLAHARYIFDPPRTRMNPQGFVEDLPDEAEAAALANQDPAPGEQRPHDRIPGPSDADRHAPPSLPGTTGETGVDAQRQHPTTEPGSADGIESAG